MPDFFASRLIKLNRIHTLILTTDIYSHVDIYVSFSARGQYVALVTPLCTFLNNFFICVLLAAVTISLPLPLFLSLPLAFSFSTSLSILANLNRFGSDGELAYSLAGVDHQFLYRAPSEYPLVTAPLLTKHVISLVYDVWSPCPLTPQCIYCHLLLALAPPHSCDLRWPVRRGILPTAVRVGRTLFVVIGITIDWM